MAASALATDSVEGQRARPSGVMRFDLLNVVGSSPERLARPGRRELGARGEPVERGPDLIVRQRCAGHPGLRSGFETFDPPVGIIALDSASVQLLP